MANDDVERENDGEELSLKETSNREEEVPQKDDSDDDDFITKDFRG